MEPSSSNESVVSTSSGRQALPLLDDVVALSRPSLVLESYEVKLAKYAMAMKEHLIMAAEKGTSASSPILLPFQIPLAKVFAHAHVEPTTYEPTPSTCDSVFCAPALFEQQQEVFKNKNPCPFSWFFL